MRVSRQWLGKFRRIGMDSAIVILCRIGRFWLRSWIAGSRCTLDPRYCRSPI